MPLGGIINGAPESSLASTVNIGFPGLDSEAIMLVLKDVIAISNGSHDSRACEGKVCGSEHRNEIFLIFFRPCLGASIPPDIYAGL